MKNVIKYFSALSLYFCVLGFSVVVNAQKKQVTEPDIIKVGIYNNPPKIFMNEKGQPDGFFVDILREIGKTENLKYEYQFDTWDHLYKKLQTGQIDVLPDVAYSSKRDSLFTLSKLPVISSWSELFSRKDVHLNSIMDVRNLKVGVLKGAIEAQYMSEFVTKEFEITFTLKTYDTFAQTVKALKNKEIDVLAADRFFAFSNLRDKNIEPTGVIIRPIGLHFGFVKNKNKALVDLFDKNITDLKNDKNSVYYTSLFHWLEKQKSNALPEYIKWFILGTIAALVFALLIVFLLRKRVKEKSDQLSAANIIVGESEDQLKTIAGNLVNGMIYQIVTIDDNVRKFNYVSDGVFNLYGCSAEEVMNDPGLIYRKIHPDDIPIMRAAELKAIHTMTNYVVEVRVINPDGSVRWSYSVAKPRYINGLLCWDGIEYDISERKQLEIDLKIAKDKAEESDRLKSAFLANMSHEIRTPMNGILGFAELLKEPTLKEKKQQKYVAIIEKSGVRMLNIINDIINISKIESGQMEVYLQDSNVNEQLEYLLTFFTPEAEKKDIALLCKKGLPYDDAYITTDREKLFAVLTNLIKNAINHTKSGTIEFGYKQKEMMLEFFVKDTGVGVPQNRQEAIFERFIQADIANKMAYQGAGLGLSISKAYVEMLGGSLWLFSEEGRGSTFFFTLPYDKKESKEAMITLDFEPPIAIAAAPSLKILIAEDDTISRMLIMRVVKDFSREIIIAKTGLEAVEACQKYDDIDLILMDAQMPEMDGYEAMTEIRKFNTTVKIIAQSAYALPGDKEKAIEAGANEYVTKPIKIRVLKEIIAQFFSN
ncbi:hypothetical protein FFWV33_10005 [Flavobacterium faecale]|uniref:histidine kinase n=1 Tax=Flavobacterium faecale TaxID=1355330 RepID=A0A2S1LDK0_9FLAO|nr:transporter substrate-binding domain-containing protein [Flavobacterium faecale]AWG21842.1 hypothetical protein FFWV33_10005 [Flavobacterium faecale]